MSMKTGSVLHKGLLLGACRMMTLLPMGVVMAQSVHGTTTSRPSSPPNPFLQNAAQAGTTTTPTIGMGTSVTPSPANGTPATNTRAQQGRNGDRRNVGSGALRPPMSH